MSKGLHIFSVYRPLGGKAERLDAVIIDLPIEIMCKANGVVCALYGEYRDRLAILREEQVYERIDEGKLRVIGKKGKSMSSWLVKEILNEED